MKKVETTEEKELPCPICDTTGFWLDGGNEIARPAVAKEKCEFCGGSGYMMVMAPEILEGTHRNEDTKRLARITPVQMGK